MIDFATHFLTMGGYARYVWPAYGLAVLVLGGMALWAWRQYRRQQRQWAAEAQMRPRRRQ